ncbi:MAG: SCP2 sterol-binding domain-containing protein [Salinisphaera sp.]|jgi:putative sterol carrier protein|nr:SCP2 sterol-binding domain-containing protein [Salinisphaera sp.]
MTDARDLLLRMPTCFKPDTAGDLSMTAQYLISQPVYLTIANGHCEAHEGRADSPDVTIRVRDEHLIQMMSGRMRGFTAFITGRVKVEGNYALAQKLQSLFEPRKLFR